MEVSELGQVFIIKGWHDNKTKKMWDLETIKRLNNQTSKKATITKRTFIKVADILKQAKLEHQNKQASINEIYRDLTFDLADYFEGQNPRFDRERFLNAVKI